MSDSLSTAIPQYHQKYLCICIVHICGASSFSYRSTQHVSTWLLTNAFARESAQSAQALLLQTRQDSYSAQLPQKSSYHCRCCRDGVLPCHQVPLSHIIVIAAIGKEYCHAGRCHYVISLSLLLQGVLPCLQVPLSYIIVIPAGRVYCHAGKCHSLSTYCLLQYLHSPYARVWQLGVSPRISATLLSYPN